MPKTDFEVIIESFGGIVGMGVDFLKYVHIGPLSLLPPSIAVIVLIVICILGFYYLIKLIKILWDVLPLV